MFRLYAYLPIRAMAKLEHRSEPLFLAVDNYQYRFIFKSAAIKPQIYNVGKLLY